MRILIVCLVMLLAIGASVAVAAVPPVVNFQGRVTDTAGTPLADGNYLIKFSIYDAPAGGSELWTSGFQNLTTQGGLFTYPLGSNVALPDDLFTDTSRYVGITVGVDPELTPRTHLESVPYSYHALRADSALVSGSSTGLTQHITDGLTFNTGFTNILSEDSINCPAAGYVIVQATANIGCLHTAGDDEAIFVLVVDSTLTVYSDQNTRSTGWSAAVPTGLYNHLVHVHSVFTVTQPGWHTFATLGAHQNFGTNSDNAAASNVTMSLLFVPQAFGTVDQGVPLPPTSPLNSLPLKLK